MPYVTQDDYLNTFHGEPVDNADFPSLLDRAVEIVEEMCMYRIRPELMDTYGVDTQERIQDVYKRQVINLWYPRIGDYFQEIQYGGYKSSNFEYEGIRYLSIDADDDSLTRCV